VPIDSANAASAIPSALAELFFEGTNALLQGGEPLLLASDDLVAPPTSRTGKFVHTRIL
jgi:hypothetical protein